MERASLLSKLLDAFPELRIIGAVEQCLGFFKSIGRSRLFFIVTGIATASACGTVFSGALHEEECEEGRDEETDYEAADCGACYCSGFDV